MDKFEYNNKKLKLEFELIKFNMLFELEYRFETEHLFTNLEKLLKLDTRPYLEFDYKYGRGILRSSSIYDSLAIKWNFPILFNNEYISWYKRNVYWIAEQLDNLKKMKDYPEGKIGLYMREVDELNDKFKGELETIKYKYL